MTTTTTTTDLEFYRHTQRGLIGIFRQAQDGSRVNESIRPGQVFAITPADRALNEQGYARPQYNAFRNGCFVRIPQPEHFTPGIGDAPAPPPVRSGSPQVGGPSPHVIDRAAAASAASAVAPPVVAPDSEPPAPAPVGATADASSFTDIPTEEAVGVAPNPEPVSVLTEPDMAAILAERGNAAFTAKVTAISSVTATRHLLAFAEERGLSVRKMGIIRDHLDALTSQRVTQPPPPEVGNPVGEVPVDAVPDIVPEAPVFLAPSDTQPTPPRRAAPLGAEMGEEAIYAFDTVPLDQLGAGEPITSSAGRGD